MIEPRVFRGVRDILPQEMFLREELIGRIKEIFHLYGFLPLETPAFEFVDILEGKYGGECEKLIYKLAYADGNTLALRYDLTVPLARFFAMNRNNLPIPFKRYQIQPVWRAERAQLRQGRYREFYQCDVDIVGSEELTADADIIALACDCLNACGIEDFVMKINDRRILKGIIEFAHLPPESELEILRVIDKLDKVGQNGVEDELRKKGFSGQNISRLFHLLNLNLDDPEIDVATNLSDSLRRGVEELRALKSLLLNINIPENILKFDLHLARGLDYYTGAIFEAVIPSLPHLGSLAGGGRYDELIYLFTGEKIPGVGVTVGLDRIMTALVQLNRVALESSKTVLLFINFGNENLTLKSLRLVRECRKDRIPADFYYPKKRLKSQLAYANKLKIPYVAFLGEGEDAENVVLVRNMTTGEELKLPQKNFASSFKKIASEAGSK